MSVEAQGSTSSASPALPPGSQTPHGRPTPPMSGLISGFSGLRVTRGPGRRRRRATLASEHALKVKNETRFKSASVGHSPNGKKETPEKRPLVLPSRLQFTDGLQSFTSLSTPESRRPAAVVSPAFSVAWADRDSGGSADFSPQSYRGHLARSHSSSSLPSLDEDQKSPLGLAPFCGHALSQSVQDFSECCRELASFSLGDQDDATVNSHSIASSAQPLRSAQRRRRGRGSGATASDHASLSLGHTPTDTPLGSSPFAGGGPSCPHSSSCASQALHHVDYLDISVNDLAGYLEDSIIFPKKMSYMAEMMYTPNRGMTSSTVAALARDFLTLQEERVRQYAAWEQAHKAYLSSAPDYDLDSFQPTVTRVTQAFQEISRKIIDMKTEFEQVLKAKDLANYLAKIQLLEQKKLKFTVDHQLALQQVDDHPDDDLMKRNEVAIKKELVAIAAEINETLEEVRYAIHDLEEEIDQ
eukprot:maker-scaffold168_size293125-snap-gene-1.76 protein:Tk04476 transcript:maker-scaffold168_size293125-snap-gene-1.76-mRNA-1 annotation:"PREDICTED: uncharacterized protein C19orf60 homolog"